MMRALYSAASGMMASQMNIDNISNNLANYQSTGFKKSRVSFEDLLYATMETPGAEGTGAKTQLGMGVRTVNTQKLFSQGQLQQTNNPYDCAIEGDGFFKVKMADGRSGYTRDGQFQYDAKTNELKNSSGGTLGVHIPKDMTNIEIAPDGLIKGTRLNGNGNPEVIGQLKLTRFLNPSALQSIGGNLMVATPNCGAPTEGIPGKNGLGSVAQGHLEKSNINIVEEMINIVQAQRSFEMNQKGVSAADDMMRNINQMSKG
jgi:flagellar basal-body rod protein FlgG